MKGFSHQMESIYWSLFLSFIHLLLHRLSNGYRNLFDILNNNYQCCTNQIRISSNAANLLNYLCFCQLFVGVIFTDIDECVVRSHSCSPDAYCNNTKGSYNCTCKPGFTGSGRECKGERYFWEYWAKEDFLISKFLIKCVKCLYSVATPTGTKDTNQKLWLKNQIVQDKHLTVLHPYILLFS